MSSLSNSIKLEDSENKVGVFLATYLYLASSDENKYGNILKT